MVEPLDLADCLMPGQLAGGPRMRRGPYSEHILTMQGGSARFPDGAAGAVVTVFPPSLQSGQGWVGKLVPPAFPVSGPLVWAPASPNSW